MTTTISRSYKIQVSFDDYNESHEYRRGSYANLYLRSTKFYYGEAEVSTLKDAIKVADSQYTDNGTISWVAYWITETVVTKSEEQSGSVHTTNTKVQTIADAYTKFRSFEDYQEFVVAPAAAREQARIESGEEALEDARYDEYQENKARELRGEPLVHTAEIAWSKFKGYAVSPSIIEAERKRLNPSLVKRAWKRLVS